jgi:hypothetical protein
MDGAEAFLLGEVGSAVVKRDARCTRIVAVNLEIDPIEGRTDAKMEGFGQRFFGREAGGVATKLGGAGEGFAIGNLDRGEDTVAEPLSVFGNASLDARDLNEVRADAVDRHFLTRVGIHKFAHFGDGMMKADSKRTRDEMMADVKLGHIRNMIEVQDVGGINPVPCIDLKAQLMA